MQKIASQKIKELIFENVGWIGFAAINIEFQKMLWKKIVEKHTNNLYQ